MFAEAENTFPSFNFDQIKQHLLYFKQGTLVIGEILTLSTTILSKNILDV